MRRGYVGERARKRKRYKFFFLFLILIILAFIFFIISIEDQSRKTIKIKEQILNEESSVLIQKFELKLFQAEQRLQMRDSVINSFEEKIKALEENNDGMNATIKLLKLENEQKNIKSKKLQNDYLIEIEKLQNNINTLNKEIKTIEENFFSNEENFFSKKKENDIIKNQIAIIENNNKTLELQKDISLEKINELKKKIVAKDKLIKEMKDKIHH